MFPLSKQEQQEISAAYENAMQKAIEAGQAAEELLEVVKSRSAYLEEQKIGRLRTEHGKVNLAAYRLSKQWCDMLKVAPERKV